MSDIIKIKENSTNVSVNTTGLQGPKGFPGATGASGIGLIGATGLTGIQGLIGATGIQGQQGSVGSQGATGLTGATGIQGITSPKAVVVKTPSNTEKIILFFAATSITISEIRSLVSGTTPSVSFSIRYGADASAAGTEVVTGGMTVTNTTTGLSTTLFNSATIPADNFVWLTTTATSGTVDWLHVSVIF